MYKANDSHPKTFLFDTTFEGLAGQSYTYFNNDHCTALSEETLHRAALQGDTEFIKRALNAGIHVDAIDDEGTTALILASQRKTSSNALCYAAQGGYLPIVKLLLQYGADVAHTGLDNVSPFHLAVQCNHPDVCEAILAANDEYKKVLLDSSLPMYVAAQHGHTAIIRMLISHGSDINLQRRVITRSKDNKPSIT
ncbi:hypothetical protein CEXT_686231, partial [Caerostris extrusa]